MIEYRLVKNTKWKELEVNGEVKDIPISWGKEFFNKLFTIGSSRRVHANKYVESGVPFFRGTEITNLKKGVKNFNTFISNDYFEELKKNNSLPQIDDILVTAVGTVGSVYLIDKKFDFYFKDGNIIWLKNKNNESKKYIEYFLNSEYCKKFIFNLGEGSAYNALSIEKFSHSECILPPFHTQKSIVTILSKQESIIQETESLISKYESRLQYLSDELLSGRLRVKDVDEAVVLYKNPDDNWKEVEINGEDVEIPSDWNVEKIKQSIKFTIGNTPKKIDDNYSGDLPWITISDLGERFVSNCTSKIKRLKNVKIIPKGSLLGSFKMSIGKFGFTTEDCATNEAIIAISPNDATHDINYLYYKLPSVFLDNAEPNGQGALLLNTTKIKELDCIFPLLNEQSLIVNVLATQEELIEQQKELLVKEKQRFDWLLENLLSGNYLVEEI